MVKKKNDKKTKSTKNYLFIYLETNTPPSLNSSTIVEDTV